LGHQFGDRDPYMPGFYVFDDCSGNGAPQGDLDGLVLET